MQSPSFSAIVIAGDNYDQLKQVEIAQPSLSTSGSRYAIEARSLNIYYGNFRAVKDVNLTIPRQKITAIIGPSGCGKSTVLRAFNRMNDLVPTAHSEGEVLFHGQNIYAPDVDPVEVRRYIGMVFQKPNPFPKSIYENVAWGARINGFKGNTDELVENALRGAALWDEVKTNYSKVAYHYPEVSSSAYVLPGQLRSDLILS